jgi:hypothetical protein
MTASPTSGTAPLTVNGGAASHTVTTPATATTYTATYRKGKK